MPHATSQARIDKKLGEIQRDVEPELDALFQELNRARLSGKGKIARLIRDRTSLRWSLTWREESGVTYELVVILYVEDDGRTARFSKGWVHRRASAPVEYEGHTPTTRMRRIANPSPAEIKDAILAEWTL